MKETKEVKALLFMILTESINTRVNCGERGVIRIQANYLCCQTVLRIGSVSLMTH